MRSRSEFGPRSSAKRSDCSSATRTRDSDPAEQFQGGRGGKGIHAPSACQPHSYIAISALFRRSQCARAVLARVGLRAWDGRPDARATPAPIEADIPGGHSVVMKTHPAEEGQMAQPLAPKKLALLDRLTRRAVRAAILADDAGTRNRDKVIARAKWAGRKHRRLWALLPTALSNDKLSVKHGLGAAPQPGNLPVAATHLSTSF